MRGRIFKLTALAFASAIIASSLFLSSYFENAALALIHGFARDTLGQTSKGAEAEKENSLSLLMQIYFDSDFQSFMYAKELDGAAIGKYQVKLRFYGAANGGIHSIYVYNGFMDSFMTSHATVGIRPGSDFFDPGVLPLLSSREHQQLRIVPRSVPSPISPLIAPVDIVSFVYFDTLGQDGKAQGAVVLNMAVSRLSDIIKSMDVYRGSKTLVADGALRVVYSSTDEPLGFDLSSYPYAGRIRANPEMSGFFVDGEGVSKALVSYKRSEQLGWTFIRITPYALIRDTIKGTRIFSLIISFGATLLAIGASFALSQRIGKPYDEVLARVAALEQESREGVYVLKQQFLQDLLSETDGERAAASIRNISGFSLAFREKDQCRLIILLIDQFSVFCEKYSRHDRQLIKYALMNVAASIFGTAKIETVDPAPESVVIIIDASAEAEPKIEKLRIYARESLHVSLSFGIGKALDGLSGLGDGYARLKNLERRRFFLGHGCVINEDWDTYPDHNLQAAGAEPGAAAYTEKELSDAVQGTDAGALSKLYQCSVPSLKGNYAAAIAQAFKLLFDVGAGLEHLEQGKRGASGIRIETYIPKISACETQADLEYLFDGLFIRIAGWRTEQLAREPSAHDRLIGKIDQCIENEHADLNLSLAIIADRFGMSSEYLGKLYKTHTGRSVAQSLMAKRLEAAKGYLNAGELSIREIAERTGFGNANYFYAAFRKHLGLTPAEYRAARRQSAFSPS